MSRTIIYKISFSLVAVLMLPQIFFVGAVHSASSGGIGGRPAHPVADNPRSQSIFIYSLDTGQSKDDQIMVSNNSDQVRTISIYAVDGVVTNTGAYTCKQEVEPLTSAGGWISMAENRITLDPGNSRNIDFNVTVPSAASSGEHSACIVLQDYQDAGQDMGNIRLRTRQAVRVAVTVPGELWRSVEVRDFTINTQGRLQRYNLSLQNTGNVSADTDISITLKSIFGKIEYDDGGQYPVMRDQELSLVFDNTDLPFFGGWYIAQAEVVYDKRAGSFGVSSLGSDVMSVSARPVVVFIMPSFWALVSYLILTVLGVGVLVCILRRHVLAKKRAQTWRAYRVKESDTIQSLADSVGVDWRLIAKTNKSKAPYILALGSSILLPKVDDGPSSKE